MDPVVVVFGIFALTIVLGIPIATLILRRKSDRSFHRFMRFILIGYLCWFLAFVVFLLVTEKTIHPASWAFFALWAVVAIVYWAVSPRE